ncbi:MAG: potassium channel protein [Bacteroidota bacterium]|nr:potassium channel protein [Bacteroidota bacterium]
MPNTRRDLNLQVVHIALLFILATISFGVIGFIFIEDMTFLDALYMTIITISTVGYGEVKELSSTGKIFTIILIISSLGTFTYTLTKLTSFFIDGHIGTILGLYKKRHEKHMKNHVIIVGFGRNGKQTAIESMAHGHKSIIVENNHNIIMDNMEEFNFIEGNGTEDEVLLSADIKDATALIATLPDDANNLYIVLTARSLNPKLKIISRAASASAEKKLRMAGVDQVVMPEQVGGSHMAKLVSRSDIVEFLDYLSIRGEAPAIIDEIECSDICAAYNNLNLSELNIRKKFGANIVGFKTPTGEYIINPTPDTKLIKNSKLFVLGTPTQIEMMKKYLAKG